MFRQMLSAALVATTVSACAGRAPAPVPVVQMHDDRLDCSAIIAEVQANDAKIKQLGKESGEKVAQNVIMGTVGAVVFFPALFLMDFQGAADKETAALQQRQSYLAKMSEQRSCAAPLPAPTPAS